MNDQSKTQWAEEKLKGLTGYQFWRKFRHESIKRPDKYAEAYQLWKQVNGVKDQKQRYTKQIRTYKIKEPYWKHNGIGVSKEHMYSDPVYIEIMYESKVSGHQIYPGIYTISKEKAMSFKTERISGTDKDVHIIPVEALKPLRDDSVASESMSEEQLVEMVKNTFNVN